MPVGALGGAIVVSYLITLLHPVLPIHPVIAAGLFSTSYVLIAYSIAPRAKLRTGVVMGALLSAAWLMPLTFAWYSPHFTRNEAIIETWRMIGIAIGVASTLAKLRSDA